MYTVESWNNWDYPSHWTHERDFDNAEDAITYCESQKVPSDYRVIEIIWSRE